MRIRYTKEEKKKKTLFTVTTYEHIAFTVLFFIGLPTDCYDRINAPEYHSKECHGFRAKEFLVSECKVFRITEKIN